MKIALVQMNSVDDLAFNLEKIKNYIQEAANENAELVVFPENSIYFRIQKETNIVAVNLQSSQVIEISQLCKQLAIAAHLTTAVQDAGLVYNASILIESDGRSQITYKKMHLFDIAIEGQAPVRESDVFSSGSEPNTFSLNGFKVGSSICYDVRFAELYANYAKQEVDLILVPSAFLVKTGRDHWETLLRARAIESQCYVLAPAQSGVHLSTRDGVSKRETYGHAMAINPWGQVIAVLSTGVGLIYCELSKQELNKVREQIPMKSHRRSVL